MVKVKMRVTFEDYKKKGNYIFFHSTLYRIVLLLLIALAAFSFWKVVLQKQLSIMDIIGTVLGLKETDIQRITEFFKNNFELHRNHATSRI